MAQVLDFFAEFAAKIEDDIPESDPNAHRYELSSFPFEWLIWQNETTSQFFEEENCESSSISGHLNCFECVSLFEYISLFHKLIVLK
jgi:hypothetical protein